MKTTKKHFEIFKKECKYWKDKFGLNEFEFRFFWKDNEGRASIDINQVSDGLIKIYFGKDFSDTKYEQFNINEMIKEIAKHEMIHALLAKFSFIGEKRYITEEELYKEEEFLVNKLINLIN